MEVMAIPHINIKHPSKFISDNSETKVMKSHFSALTLKLSLKLSHLYTVKTQALKIYLELSRLIHKTFHGQKKFN